MARIARALEHGVGEREVLLHVSLDAEEVCEVEAGAAVHGIPADGALQGLDRHAVVADLDVGEREIAVQAVEGFLDITQLARVVLDAAVRQAVEHRGEREPLERLGGGAVAVDILLGILGEAREQLDRLLVMILHEVALGAQDLVCHVGPSHVAPRDAVCGTQLCADFEPPAKVKSMRPRGMSTDAMRTATRLPGRQTAPVDSLVRVRRCSS